MSSEPGLPILADRSPILLLHEFRNQYLQLEAAVKDAILSGVDTIILERLADRLATYVDIMHTVSS